MTPFSRILALAAALIFAAPPAFALEVVGRIDELVPAAFHTPPDAQQMEARKLDPVVRNETLTTTDAGGLLVTFADGSELTLGANSQAVIDEFVYPGPGQGNATIQLISGVFRFVSGQMDEAGVQIETPTASIGIRGTVIYVGVFDGTTLQITKQGRSAIRSKLTGQVSEVAEGNAISVDKTGRFSAIVPFGASVDQAGMESPEVMLGIVPADVQSSVPGEIELIPSRSAADAGGIKFALAKQGDLILNDSNTQQTYLAGFLLYEQGYNPGRLTAAAVARGRATTVMTRRTSEIGSATGRATRAARPADTSNDIVAGVIVSDSPLSSSEWTITAFSRAGNGTSPDEVYTPIDGADTSRFFAEGASFGSVVAPDGTTITSLNNSGVPRTQMVKTFTLGPGQRVFSLAGLGNFITNEFPTYVGSQYNDNTTVYLETSSGQLIDLSSLFAASLNEDNFTLVNGLPSPLGSQGGETGWKSFLNRIRVAPGSQVRLIVQVTNVGDTAVPSAILLNGLNASGGR